MANDKDQEKNVRISESNLPKSVFCVLKLNIYKFFYNPQLS